MTKYAPARFSRRLTKESREPRELPNLVFILAGLEQFLHFARSTASELDDLLVAFGNDPVLVKSVIHGCSAALFLIRQWRQRCICRKE